VTTATSLRTLSEATELHGAYRGLGLGTPENPNSGGEFEVVVTSQNILMRQATGFEIEEIGNFPLEYLELVSKENLAEIYGAEENDPLLSRMVVFRTKEDLYFSFVPSAKSLEVVDEFTNVEFGLGIFNYFDDANVVVAISICFSPKQLEQGMWQKYLQGALDTKNLPTFEHGGKIPPEYYEKQTGG